MMDNYDIWEQHERDRERALAKLPVCDICGEPIQTEYTYEVDGSYICETCMVEYFRKNTEDLIGE